MIGWVMRLLGYANGPVSEIEELKCAMEENRRAQGNLSRLLEETLRAGGRE